MPNLNFLVSIRSYSDSNPSNDPSLNNIRWTREISGLSVDKPASQEFSLAPGETKSFFNNSRTLTQDNTTQYDLAIVPLTSNTYRLSWTGGAAPSFRTARTPGADATTQVTVTSNGPVLTFASTGGTAFSFITGGVVVGDILRLGNLFNPVNQGAYKILALTATSVSVANELGAPEGPITLGAGFAVQFQVYSAAGVQIGDVLNVSGGFSPVTQGSYEVTDATASYLDFYSTDILPQESGITTQVSVYSSAVSFLYLEADQKCQISINSGALQGKVNPFVINSSTQPGVFMNSSTVFALSVTNVSTDTANCFLASAE